MNTYPRIVVMMLFAVVVMNASAHPQSVVGIHQQDVERFLVLIKNASTRRLVNDANISVRMYTTDGKNRAGGVSGHTDDGMVLVGLGGGKHQIVFEAEGYHPLMVKDCSILSKVYEGAVITFGGNELRFVGNSFVYTVLLEARNGKPAQWRFKRFLSDSVYYREPQVPPELVGGVEGLKARLRPDMLGGVPRTDRQVSSVGATVFIAKNGKVDSVDVYGPAPRHVLGRIADVIKKSRFTEARILGNPVRSMVFIPFEFALVWKEGGPYEWPEVRTPSSKPE